MVVIVPKNVDILRHDTAVSLLWFDGADYLKLFSCVGLSEYEQSADLAYLSCGRVCNVHVGSLSVGGTKVKLILTQSARS